MDFSRLEQNIIDVIKEEQIKLGYQKEVIRLYYPLQSLNRFLKAEYGMNQMQELLEQHFASGSEDMKNLGEIVGDVSVCMCGCGVQVTHKDERFCFFLPESIVEDVHEHMQDHEFIREFIETIRKHGCTIEGLLKVFKKQSEHVYFEKMNHGEFDYLIYFEDGVPDDFRYCITDELCHMIYHRFTPEDYADFEE